jgi:hypothetical protein
MEKSTTDLRDMKKTINQMRQHIRQFDGAMKIMERRSQRKLIDGFLLEGMRPLLNLYIGVIATPEVLRQVKRRIQRHLMRDRAIMGMEVYLKVKLGKEKRIKSIKPTLQGVAAYDPLLPKILQGLDETCQKLNAFVTKDGMIHYEHDMPRHMYFLNPIEQKKVDDKCEVRWPKMGEPQTPRPSRSPHILRLTNDGVRDASIPDFSESRRKRKMASEKNKMMEGIKEIAQAEPRLKPPKPKKRRLKKLWGKVKKFLIRKPKPKPCEPIDWREEHRRTLGATTGQLQVLSGMMTWTEMEEMEQKQQELERKASVKKKWWQWRKRRTK